MRINISEIDPNRILNMSEYDCIGLTYIPINDIIYLYPNTIIATIGSILNIFSVIIYFKKEFSSELFFYFSVLSVCYLIQTTTGTLYSYCNVGRYQTDAIRKPCAYYLTSFVAFGSFLSYYESVLEIAILLDRLKLFNKTIKKYLTLKPRLFCLILFVICFFVHLFYMFAYTPQEFVWYNYKQDGTLERKSVWNVVTSNFALSNISRIFIILTYIVRELVTIIFCIGFSLFLSNYMRTYFKNKAKMVNKTVLTMALSKSRAVIQSKSTQLSSVKQLNNCEEKFLQLVIAQCSLTVFTRSNFFICCVMALFNYGPLTQMWCAVADFSIFLTPAVSFFLYFFFNKLFKREFLKLFQINSKQ